MEVIANILIGIGAGLISSVVVTLWFSCRDKKKQHIATVQHEIFQIQEGIPKRYTDILLLIYNEQIPFIIKFELLKNFLTTYCTYFAVKKDFPDLYDKIDSFYRVSYSAVKDIQESTEGKGKESDLISRELFLDKYFEPMRKLSGDILVLSAEKYAEFCTKHKLK